MAMIDRYRGALIGLAAGDALGTTVEFSAPGTFQPVTDITGGGPFHLEPGQWTDDTSLALCLAESLVEKRGFDPVDQLGRYAPDTHGERRTRRSALQVDHQQVPVGTLQPRAGLLADAPAGAGDRGDRQVIVQAQGAARYPKLHVAAG